MRWIHFKYYCHCHILVGITNHDEYSLVRDLPEAERERTLTLKRDKSIAKDQKKMDEMKKKLHTDDERKPFLMRHYLKTKNL